MKPNFENFQKSPSTDGPTDREKDQLTNLDLGYPARLQKSKEDNKLWL